MNSASNKLAEADSSKRLTVRLSKGSESERVLEFHAGHDRARVVGRAPNSDIMLVDAGVLPVHCYFEREHDAIWLSAAKSEALIKVNYQPIRGRTKLGCRCILEVGDARLLVVVLEEDEDSPSHGPFGTEVIDVRAVRVAADFFETISVDAHVVLGDLPTTAWQNLAPDESRATSTAWQGNSELEIGSSVTDGRSLSGAVSTSASSTSDVPPVVDSVRIPRSAVLAKSCADSTQITTEPIRCSAPTTAPPIVEPVKPSPCILIEARNRLVSAPAITAAEQPYREASAPPLLPLFDPPRVTNDPGGFTTVGQPIADLRTAEPSRKAPSGRPVCRFATLRQQFAVGPGRDPRVVAAIGVYAALSLVAVVAQTVRGWPYFVDHPVVGGNGPHAVERVAHPRLPSNTGPGLVNGGPDLASSAPEALPSERPTSAGDPLVGQAVNHLLRGREAEAAGVYAALAGRYPSEPVYAATVKVLRRRLNPACQQGIEIDCGKALP